MKFHCKIVFWDVSWMWDRKCILFYIIVICLFALTWLCFCIFVISISLFDSFYLYFWLEFGIKVLNISKNKKRSIAYWKQIKRNRRLKLRVYLWEYKVFYKLQYKLQWRITLHENGKNNIYETNHAGQGLLNLRIIQKEIVEIWMASHCIQGLKTQ